MRVRGSVCYVIYKTAKWVDLIPFMTSYSVTNIITKLALGEKSPLKTKCLEIKTFKKILRELLSRCTLQNVE